MSADAPAAAAPAPSDVRIVDAYPDGAALVAAGAAAFSRAVLGAAVAQLDNSAAEARALERATALVGDAVAGMREDAAGAAALLRAAGAHADALRPHLAALDALDGVVAEVEDAARALDAQTRQLEAAFATLL